MPDDFDASIATLGSALDGIPVVGDIEELGDQDWFAVSLVQGNQYEIEVRGADTADGTLEGPARDWLEVLHPQDRDRFRATLDAATDRSLTRITRG